MSADLPPWLASAQPQHLEPPSWLAQVTGRAGRADEAHPERKAATLTRYELVFPRVLEYIYAGQTLKRALRDLPGHYGGIDAGGFTRWINASPTRKMLYKEAKEIRTEAYADDIVRHSRGENEDGTASPNDVARDRLIVESLKWLMGANNRKEYGDTKTIDVTGNISIVGALEAARSRVEQVVNIDLVDDSTPLLLEEPQDVDENDDDDDGDDE